jgi:ATP-dependent DNA helicase RecG
METTNIEWKLRWKNEYLSELCAFANSYGGSLIVGRNDDGQDIGVDEQEAKRLLDILPNIISQKLSIFPEIREKLLSTLPVT